MLIGNATGNNSSEILKSVGCFQDRVAVRHQGTSPRHRALRGRVAMTKPWQVLDKLDASSARSATIIYPALCLIRAVLETLQPTSPRRARASRQKENQPES
jgi:hypothetical protein